MVTIPNDLVGKKIEDVEKQLDEYLKILNIGLNYLASKQIFTKKWRINKFLDIILQGFPTATEFDGTSFVTTLPAPTTTLSPIVIPGNTITPAPSQQFLPI